MLCSMGTECSLLYQACVSPVVCESKQSLAYQLRTNHFLSQTRGKKSGNTVVTINNVSLPSCDEVLLCFFFA